jgi:hypothetical protein
MSDEDRMLIQGEGEPPKTFRVWWMGKDNGGNDVPYKCEGEYDTAEEVKAHRWSKGRVIEYRSVEST